MVWLYLLPFLVFAQTTTPSATSIPTPSFTPTPTPLPLTISGLPSQITAGQQFNVTLNLHAKTNLSYLFKVYGGVNGDNYSYEVQNGDSWINGYNGKWESLPQSSTDAGGNSSLELTVRFRTDKTSGTSQLIAKVREPVATASNYNYLISSSYNIDIIDPSPTPLPVSADIPIPSTSPPIPTNVPTPTNTPTITPTPIPTDTPLPILTPVVEATPTDSPNDPVAVNATPNSSLLGNVLGISNPEASGSGGSRFANLLPLIFIIAGGILLATPLIISQIKTHWLPKK